MPSILVFDIFGTVVDWHGSIVREVAALYPQVDADAFALAWRAGYQPAMQRVRGGETGWTRLDELHRGILDEILPRFGLQHLDDAERAHLNRVWHRLAPWPDSVAELAVRLLATETAAPTPTKPPAPAMARLVMAGEPCTGVRVPDAMAMPSWLVSWLALTLALLAPPRMVTATPALTPAALPPATAPASFSTEVRSRLLTVTAPAWTLAALRSAEVECSPAAPPKAPAVS